MSKTPNIANAIEEIPVWGSVVCPLTAEAGIVVVGVGVVITGVGVIGGGMVITGGVVVVVGGCVVVVGGRVITGGGALLAITITRLLVHRTSDNAWPPMMTSLMVTLIVQVPVLLGVQSVNGALLKSNVLGVPLPR